jgi:hypothetical protein
VVSFTPRLLYPRGRSPWYPFDRRLGGLSMMLIIVIIITTLTSKYIPKYANESVSIY